MRIYGIVVLRTLPDKEKAGRSGCGREKEVGEDRKRMITLRGNGVSEGICIGRIVYVQRGKKQIAFRRAESVEAELVRFKQAVKQQENTLGKLYEESVKMTGKKDAEVFQAQKLLLQDEIFTERVCEIIQSRQSCAEYAVWTAGEELAATLESAEDAYIRERGRDVRAVTAGILEMPAMGGKGYDETSGKTDAEGNDSVQKVIFAEDLFPAEAVELAGKNPGGFVLSRGSALSHTAILAVGMGVPAVFGIDEKLPEELNGKPVIVDGYEGMVYIEPDCDTLVKMRKKKEKKDEDKQSLRELVGKENVTRAGRRIKLYANVGNLKDVEMALLNDADGIGLLRSEFLYLESENAPDEEMQYAFYSEVLRRMGGREVVIRTFDIGADKQVPYIPQEQEENPALGLRGIRLGLRRPDLLKTQLRALYRAGVCGKLLIMYPMITSKEELDALKKLEEETKEELLAQGIAFAGDITVGIMIETPAAALLSEELAKETDFFSIGSNDLTQYVYAMDRQNHNLDGFRDANHRATLKMMEMVAENAHKAGIWVGICGEMASDTDFTERLVEIGVDEFSVPAGEILRIRKKIREI